MKLTKYEKETAVLWNQAEQTASVYTHDTKLKNNLKKYAMERPEEVKIERETKDYIDAIIPKKWVKIRPPRTLSEAQKEALRAARERAAAEPERLFAARGST